MTPPWNVAFSLAWIAAGTVSLGTMLRLFGGEAAETRDRVVRVHRWSGRVFVGLYLVLLGSMLWKVRVSGAFPPLATGHLVFGLVLAPLIAVKVLIARRWKPLHKMLPALGLVVAALAFVTAALGWLLFWEGSRGFAADDAALASAPGRPEARAAFTAYCGQCHPLSRPLDRARGGGMTEADWRGILAKMRGNVTRRGARMWAPAEADLIVEFLLAQPADAAGSVPAGGGGTGDDRGRRGRGRGADD